MKQEHLNKYVFRLRKVVSIVFIHYCSIFHNNTGHGFNNLTPLKSLVVETLKKISKLLGKDRNVYHNNSVLNGKQFLNSYNNPELEVVNQIDSHRQNLVKEKF